VKLQSGGSPESSQTGFFAWTKRGQLYEWGHSLNMATTSNGAWTVLAPKYVALDGIANALTTTVTDGDGDATNEIQNLVYTPAAQTLQISGGNTVDLKKSVVSLQIGAGITATSAVVAPVTGASVTEIADELNECVAGTFTPTVSGNYLISAHVEWNSATWANGVSSAIVFATAAGAEITGASNAVSPAITVASIIDSHLSAAVRPLTAGTSYRFQLFQNSGAVKTATAGVRSYFTITRL
jgi:hypothetical protein